MCWTWLNGFERAIFSTVSTVTDIQWFKTVVGVEAAWLLFILVQLGNNVDDFFFLFLIQSVEFG